MKNTLERAKGFGCAAVHVGVLKRVVLIPDNITMELKNPVIVAKSSETARFLEGSIAPGAPRGYVEKLIFL